MSPNSISAQYWATDAPTFPAPMHAILKRLPVDMSISLGLEWTEWTVWTEWTLMSF